MHTIAPPGLWKARHLSRAAFAALGALTVLLIIAHIQLTCGEPIMQGLRDGTSDAMLKRAQKPSQGGIANCHDMASYLQPTFPQAYWSVFIWRPSQDAAVSEGEELATRIRTPQICDVDVPPDKCLQYGSAYSFAYEILGKDYNGIGMYSRRTEEANDYPYGEPGLVNAIIDLNYARGSDHAFADSVRGCADAQFDSDAGFFDKSAAADCIAKGIEGGTPRSVVVLVGRLDVNKWGAYLPLGMLAQVNVDFRRKNQNGMEIRDRMCIVIQL